MAGRDGVLAPLDGRSGNLFLAAGGLLVVFAANTGARVLADSGVPAVHSTVGPAGFLVGLLGLFGLYGSLADEVPWIARVAGVVAAVPAAGWAAITVFGVGSSIGVSPGMSVVLPVPVVPVVVFLTTLAYLLFGAASLRAGVGSRTSGVALLVPAVPFLGLIVGLAVLGPVAGAEVVIDVGHALAHLAVGFVLRNEGVSAGRGEPAAEATT